MNYRDLQNECRKLRDNGNIEKGFKLNQNKQVLYFKYHNSVFEDSLIPDSNDQILEDISIIKDHKNIFISKLGDSILDRFVNTKYKYMSEIEEDIETCKEIINNYIK